MFSAIKKIVERIKNKMFPTTTIKRAFNVDDIDIAISSDMINSIELWNNIMENKQPWLNKENGVKSLALAQGICEELSKTSTRELVSKVTSNEYVNKEYQKFIKSLNEDLQWGLAEGGIAFKPYVDGNQIYVDAVHADSFFPVAFKGKKITAAVFVEQIFKGKNVYTRLEYQNMKTEYIHLKTTPLLEKIMLMVTIRTHTMILEIK